MLRLSALCFGILRDKLSEGQHCSIVSVPFERIADLEFFSRICVQRPYEALHHLCNAQHKQQQHAADAI